MSSRFTRPILRGIRLVVIVGFGGLLALLVFLGAYSADSLRRVETLDTRSSRQYVARSDRLEATRQSAYAANSAVRNYLLDPDTRSLELHREEAVRFWNQAMASLAAYRLLSASDRKPILDRLAADFSEYWKDASTGLAYDEVQRRRRGFDLLASKLGPLRDRFLTTLDEIRTEDQKELRGTIERSSGILALLQLRLRGAIAVTLLLGFILAGITVYYLIRLENAAQSRYEMSLQAQSQLERLSQKLLNVQEDERRNLARELHDEVGQSLGALLVDIGQVQNSATPGEARPHLEAARRLAESTLASIRNLILLLRPSMLDDLGLIPALNWQARETTRRTGIDVRIIAGEADMELPDSHRTTVYRVVQEALQNAARHSGASQVKVMVRRDAERLLIAVQDNGKGFDARSTRGLGLLGMQERVANVNGSFHVESEPGRGAVLQIALPLHSPDREPAGVRT